MDDDPYTAGGHEWEAYPSFAESMRCVKCGKKTTYNRLRTAMYGDFPKCEGVNERQMAAARYPYCD